MRTLDVAIVGGGVAGLAAAFELHTRGIPFQVFESTERAGGVILTDRVDGLTIDAGPDSLLASKPAGLALCRDLGLGDRLVPTLAPRTAFVLRGGQLYPLPEASVLGVPTRVRPLVTSGLFSALGKARMAADLFLPRPDRDDGQDESIGSFFRRRFGSEIVDYVGEPLLAGIHAGDVERLSMRTLFPQLLEAECRHGSLIRAFRRIRAKRSPDGLFRSLPGGIGELAGALVERLPRDSLRLDAPVRSIESGEQLVLNFERHETVAAGAVILAVPAYVTADLVEGLDPALASLCREIPYASTATIALSYPRSAVEHPLRGTGFVVPRTEKGPSIMAASWVSFEVAQPVPAGSGVVAGVRWRCP